MCAWCSVCVCVCVHVPVLKRLFHLLSRCQQPPLSQGSPPLSSLPLSASCLLLSCSSDSGSLPPPSRHHHSFINSAWTSFPWCFDKNWNSDHNCKEWWGKGGLGRGASQTQEAWLSFFFQMCLERRIRSLALPCCLAMVMELAVSSSVQVTEWETQLT